MHFIQAGRLLVTNPGSYQLTFAEVAYRPTGSVRALGMLLFGSLLVGYGRANLPRERFRS